MPYVATVNATAAARVLIAAGADVNHRGRDGPGQTLLMQAAARGQLDSVKLLLHHGAKRDDADRDGNTALVSAAMAGHTNVVAYLLQLGANVNAINDHGWTVLMLAVKAGELGSVRLLAERGADLDSTGRRGRTALMIAARDASLEIVQCLIDHGANVGIERDGFTALRYAEGSSRHDVTLVLRRAIDRADQKGKP